MAKGITPWVSRTRPIRDGEEVRSAIANRLPLDLQQRTQHLKDRVDALSIGEAIVDFDSAVDSAVKSGQVVYFDPVSATYKQALAALAEDPETSAFTLTNSSYAIGLCVNKRATSRGDILLSGIVRDFDFTEGADVDGSLVDHAGAYYLSARTAGKYTTQKPPVGIYVAFLRGDGSAVVNPTPREVLENHIHFAFDLVSAPAGTIVCPEPDKRYQFLTADPLAPGWLPADHPSFGGTAPTGAKFGYNLAAHPKLERVWPPIPMNAVYLESDGIGVAGDVFRVDIHGLWWFEDCYSKAPWPTEEASCQGSAVSSSSSSSGDPLLCNSGDVLEQMGFVRVDPLQRRLKLYFVKLTVKTNESVVTSLEPVAGAPLKVLGCDKNEPAKTGLLCLDFDADLMPKVNNVAGYKVIKELTGHTIKIGPVIEGIKAGTGVTIVGLSGQSELDPQGYHKGKVTLSLDLPGGDQEESQVSLVALDGVREEIIDGVFFLAFPKSKASLLRGKVLLKNDIAIATPHKLELVLWLLGRASGTLPVLDFSYKTLPRPDGCVSIKLSDRTESSVAPLPVCTLSGGDEYVELVSPSIDVLPGMEIFFTLKRNGDTDGYLADLGVLKLGTRLFTGS